MLATLRSEQADLVRRDILRVATEVFAKKDLAGARVDEIALRTRTSKRMIYYHFGNKEGLYRAVLIDCYQRIREAEATLRLGDRRPLEALAELVRFTFDYQQNNIDFVRLVMVENIERARHLGQLPELASLNSKAIVVLREICRRGVAAGEFRRSVDPLDLHMSISALCFFSVANRHTFAVLHDADMMSPAALAARRESITEMILKAVRPD